MTTDVLVDKGRRATLLLVEDDVAVRIVTQRMLETAGHRVVVAENGQSALSIAHEDLNGIELLITDVMMPGIDGPELARRLRERAPSLPVLFISGYSPHPIVSDPADAPRTDFLAKPFAHDALLAKTLALLGSRVA